MSADRNRSQIEEIKEKLDLVQVAQSYISNMKRSGANYFMLCPFHNEKTPSFSINQDLQIYKCFGCGESGDVINFIQKVEGLDFPKALEKAAQMAGVQLVQYKPNPKREREYKEKQRIIEANTLAAKYYNHILLNHENGKAALEYCKGRKITKQMIEKFQIGYAPKSYDNLKRFLQKKGYDEQELLKWGLLVIRENKQKQSQAVDKFRHRLMFPIFNHQGEIVGFSGRQVEKSDYGPKYLNSPETLVYQKKETLYGLFNGKEEIRRKNFAVLVEGNVDILSSHRVGVQNILCPLGTALTIEQCKLIRRYTDTVYFCLDTDEAGEKALLKGLKLADSVGLTVLALDIGNYQDVDELIMNDPKKWQDIVNQPQEVVENLITRFAKKYKIDTARGKSGYISTLAPYIKAVSDQIIRDEYIKQVSVITEVEEELIAEKIESSKNPDEKISEVRNYMSTSRAADNQKQDHSEVNSSSNTSKKEFLAALLIQNKKLIKKAEHLDEIFEKWFYEFLFELAKGGSLKSLIDSYSEPQQKLLQRLALLDTDLKDEALQKKEIRKLVRDIKREIFKRKINKLEKKLKKAEAAGTNTDEILLKLKKAAEVLKELGK